VFVSSESGFNIPADMIHRGFTKTANLSISRGLARRLAGTGVTVNAVLPGPTLTEGVKAMLEETARKANQSIEEAATASVKARRPSPILQRMATVKEVASMIVYVCSPWAPRPLPAPSFAWTAGSSTPLPEAFAAARSAARASNA